VDKGGPKRLNPTRVLAPQYHDQTSTALKQYEYRVTAVDSKGKESRYTAVVIQTRDLIGDGHGPNPETN
jgi:hypothetical protein